MPSRLRTGSEPSLVSTWCIVKCEKFIRPCVNSFPPHTSPSWEEESRASLFFHTESFMFTMCNKKRASSLCKPVEREGVLVCVWVCAWWNELQVCWVCMKVEWWEKMCVGVTAGCVLLSAALEVWFFFTSFGLNTHWSLVSFSLGCNFFFFPGEVKLCFRSGVSSCV